MAGTNYLCSCPGPAGGTWSLVTARLRGAELGSEYSDHGLIRDWRPGVSAMFDGFKKGEYNIQRGPRLLVKRRCYDFHTLVRTTRPSLTGDKCSKFQFVWETRMLDDRQGVKVPSRDAGRWSWLSDGRTKTSLNVTFRPSQCHLRTFSQQSRAELGRVGEYLHLTPLRDGVGPAPSQVVCYGDVFCINTSC